MNDKIGVDPKVLESADPLSYEDARELLKHDDPQVRRRLASRTDISAEILYFLAEDPHPDVRREIASNDATPRKADLLLLGDTEPAVREDLAYKIAQLAPGLTANERDKIKTMTYQALESLARDQATKVRQILSEALKDVADAPPAVIRRLARDIELAVAGPVLEFSPVLTDEDLLEIIESEHANGALSAISRRSHVATNVADAIAKSDDEQAITELLSNPSAQIREETLDMLVDRAPSIEAWHDPLVHRPRLSSKAASRLATFVADTLLKVLEVREDLDPETVEAVKKEVHRRLDETTAEPKGMDRQRELAEPRGMDGEEQSDLLGYDPDDGETPMEIAERMMEVGELTEQAILDALEKDDRRFVNAALSVVSGVPLEGIMRMVSGQNAKGIVSVCWQAKMSMALAVELQTLLCNIPKSALLGEPEGDFPLSEDDMAWQIELFGGA